MDEFSKPPKISFTSSRRLTDFIPFFTRPDVEQLLATANSDYLYWDAFKALTIPKDLTPDEAWLLLKITRRQNRKKLPLVDALGQPYSYIGTQTGDLQHLLDRDRAGAALPEGMPRELRAQVKMDAAMDEAIGSCILAGSKIPWNTAKDLILTGREPADPEERMILNAHLALAEAVQRSSEPLSISFLHDLYWKLTGAEAGKFRSAQDTNPEGRNLPAADELPDRMDKMVAFANGMDGAAGEFIHPVVRAAFLHFWVCVDRPYAEANGRLARLLFLWCLLRNGYSSAELLSPSLFVSQNSEGYRRAFMETESDDNDATYFLLFLAQAMRESLAGLQERIHSKLEEFSDALKRVRKRPGVNVRQQLVLEDLLKNSSSFYTIEKQRRINEVNYMTARKDLMELERMGFLQCVRRGRSFVFVPADDFNRMLGDGPHV